MRCAVMLTRFHEKVQRQILKNREERIARIRSRREKHDHWARYVIYDLNSRCQIATWNARRIAGEMLRRWQSAHAVDVLLTFIDGLNVLSH